MNGLAGSPYYIGKGHGRRAFTKHGNVPLPNDKSKIVILSDGLSEATAHAEEKRLIALHGRIDMGTGCLRNRTDGGEGQCGRIVSADDRIRQREYMLENPSRWLPPKSWTKEELEKRSQKMRGRKRPPFSDQWRENLSIAKKGRTVTGPRKAALLEVGSSTRFAVGHQVPTEIRKKLSLAHRGKKASLETRKKMSESHRNRAMLKDRIERGPDAEDGNLHS